MLVLLGYSRAHIVCIHARLNPYRPGHLQATTRRVEDNLFDKASRHWDSHEIERAAKNCEAQPPFVLNPCPKHVRPGSQHITANLEGRITVVTDPKEVTERRALQFRFLLLPKQPIRLLLNDQECLFLENLVEVVNCDGLQSFR